MVRHRRISHRHQGSLGSAVRQSHHAGNAPAQAGQSRTGYPTPANKHWFVDDLDNPYVEEQPFDWLRGYHVGGRSLMWARQSYRLSPMDFEANAQGGRGDSLAGELRRNRAVVRQGGNLRRHQRQRRRPAAAARWQVPAAAWISTASRVDFQKRLDEKLGRKLIIGRCANLTAPLTHNESPQRGTCQCAQPVHPRLSLRRAISAASRRRCRPPNAPAT